MTRHASVPATGHRAKIGVDRVSSCWTGACATMCAKDATMSAKVAIMSGKDVTVCAKDATMNA